MKKLNRKGYLTVEIILASVITFVIAFFLIDLTMKLVDVVNDAYADIVLTTDKSLIVKNVREYLSKDMSLNGNINKVECSNKERKCKITFNNESYRYLSINAGNILMYEDPLDDEPIIYSKEIHDSLSNISLSSSTESGYYNFKILGENIFIDEDYEMNINVYNKSVPIFAPGNSWYKSSINKSEITKINFFDNHSEYENYIKQTDFEERGNWPAAYTVGSDKLSSEIMCYINGTELSIVGNGTGKIYANQNSYSMFGAYRENEKNNFISLMSIEGLGLLDTSMVTNMFALFYGCKQLKNIDLSSFDTSNVTNMAGIFAYCNMLESVDLSTFDTRKANDIRHMFSWCESLTEIDISSLEITSKLTNMTAMFQHCHKLQSIIWPDTIDTSNVIKMNYLFAFCHELRDESLEVLKKFDTRRVTTMKAMFGDCFNLTTIDVKYFDTSNVTDMSFMFSSCHMLENIIFNDINHNTFNTEKVENMTAMFQICYSLESLDLSSFNTSNVTEMIYMFKGCEKLKKLDLGSFNTKCLVYARNLFGDCTNLLEIKASTGWNVENILVSENMFFNDVNLKGGDETKFDWDYIDKTYARIDGGSSLPGYFTSSDLNAKYPEKPQEHSCPVAAKEEPDYGQFNNDKIEDEGDASEIIE